MKLLLQAHTLFLLFTTLGCASFSTTPITRLDSDIVSADSNGLSRWFCRTRPYRGIPIKVKVQTHVDVWIEEDFALKHNGTSWEDARVPERYLSIRTSPVLTEQVVISDFKRPASGSIDLTIDFTDDQYLKKVDSKIVDTTITDSAALLGTIISKVGTPTADESETKAANPSDVIWKQRTVAYQRFDINAVDYEQQLDSFVSQHMNSCNQCGAGWPTYDQRTVVN
jgi:hypothetical protein